MNNFWGQFFHFFMGQKKCFFFNIVASVLKRCIISLLHIFFWFFLVIIITPQNLKPEWKSKDTLRQVLFYLFCAARNLVLQAMILNLNRAVLLIFWGHRFLIFKVSAVTVSYFFTFLQSFLTIFLFFLQE